TCGGVFCLSEFFVMAFSAPWKRPHVRIPLMVDMVVCTLLQSVHPEEKFYGNRRSRRLLVRIPLVEQSALDTKSTNGLRAIYALQLETFARSYSTGGCCGHLCTLTMCADVGTLRRAGAGFV
ncbi:conserved hypothetical protein, partial [Trichinella spiralis]|uniref:hypothetical protein n=1 Tax=Trichinella spiralis TaxID=6334 RepID=UPI0001EFE04B